MNKSTPSKKCQVCGNGFYKKVTCSLSIWEKRKYCSTGCSIQETAVQKIAGNYWKGRIMPEEIRRKVSLATKGRPANSGSFKKGSIPPWKGKKIPEFSGENHPGWKEKTIKQCEWCKSEMQLPPWDSERRFCKSDCYHKWHRGSNSPVWTNNYKRKFRQRVMELPEYQNWRTSVFQRDHYACVQCKATGYLEADHIRPFFAIIREFNIPDVIQARECLALWDITNGQTLCKSCHRKTDTFGKRAIRTTY